MLARHFVPPRFVGTYSRLSRSAMPSKETPPARQFLHSSRICEYKFCVFFKLQEFHKSERLSEYNFFWDFKPEFFYDFFL